MDEAGHDFGRLRVDTAAEWIFTVSNAASALDTLDVEAVEADPPYAVSVESFELAPGRSLRVTVTYSPTEPGTFDRTIGIRSNDPGTPLREIQVRGTAVEEWPEITLAPSGSSYDFGAVRLGGQGTFTLKVGNDGVDPLRVEASTSPPFTATPASFRVDPGGSAELRVEYEPVEEGTQSGRLVLRSNDPDQSRVTVSLSGEGISGFPLPR